MFKNWICTLILNFMFMMVLPCADTIGLIVSPVDIDVRDDLILIITMCLSLLLVLPSRLAS